VNVNRAIRVIKRCKELCDFGDVKFLTSLPTDHEHKVEIMPLNSLIAYSVFMVTKCHEYIDTPHVLIVQRDGFILNPSSWNPAWLDLDYIGPLFMQHDHVGSGGFSLRSKRIMQDVSKILPEWDGTQKSAGSIQEGMGYYEDGFICLTKFTKKYNIAKKEDAAIFAQGGNRNPLYYREHPFGFHGAGQNINHETGKVFPVCEHKDLVCNCTMEHKTFLKSLAE
jgi:hypothetical protein